jgi:hypothetical protein
MLGLPNLPDVWRVLKEADLNKLRREAERPFKVLLVAEDVGDAERVGGLLSGPEATRHPWLLTADTAEAQRAARSVTLDLAVALSSTPDPSPALAIAFDALRETRVPIVMVVFASRGSIAAVPWPGEAARAAVAALELSAVPAVAQVRIPFGHTLPQRRESRSAIGRWLRGVSDLQASGGAGQETHSWRRVLWLTGVDYFSTLGYQPGIALLAAGAVAPLATSVLVLVTLLGALPIYAQVARRSYAGQGSIAMLENLLPGWSGKLLVLILLGFAATDFVIAMTLSAADATKHAIENPYLHPFLGDAQIGVTLILLALLAVVFLFGFRGAIGMAAVVAIPYLGLSLVVLGRGLGEIAARPELWSGWHPEDDARPRIHLLSD